MKQKKGCFIPLAVKVDAGKGRSTDALRKAQGGTESSLGKKARLPGILKNSKSSGLWSVAGGVEVF